MEYTNANPSPEKEYILSVLARNRTGVLLRIAGLFSRRCYNILSIVAAKTENEEYSRILIVASGDDRIIRQVDKQLSKLVDVVHVDVLSWEDAIVREHVLLKVKRSMQTSEKLVEMANVFQAKILNIAADSMILELTGDASTIDSFIELYNPYGVLKILRTGAMAIEKQEKQAAETEA